MKEKDLKIKLAQIKCYPSQEWKQRRKELLQAQIFGTVKPQQAGGFFNGLKIFWPAKSFRLKPAWSVLLIITTVFLAGGLSLRAARNSCPGEALYIAKRISEQTQLALTFSEKQRAKLGIEFASKRAEELNKILKQENSATEKEKHVEQLTQDFKKQIIVAKNNLARISSRRPVPTDSNVGQSEPKPTPAAAAKPPTNNDDDNKIFSANLSKDNKKIEIEPSTKEPAEPKPEANAVSPAATSSQPATASTTAGRQPNLAEVNKILAEAQQLIEKDEIKATVDKLDQANKIIDQIDESAGQVKGAAEAAGPKATSSAAVKASQPATTTASTTAPAN